MHPPRKRLSYSALNQALIAPIGHADSQAPQSMQAPASTTYFPSPSEIAPTGHEPAQLPHDTHASEIVCAIVKSSLLNIDVNVMLNYFRYIIARNPC